MVNATRRDASNGIIALPQRSTDELAAARRSAEREASLHAPRAGSKRRSAIDEAWQRLGVPDPYVASLPPRINQNRSARTSQALGMRGGIWRGRSSGARGSASFRR